VWIDRPQRKIFGHPFNEPERQLLDPARPAVRAAADSIRHVVLERVHQLVTDHVIRFSHRRRQRQHDTPLQHFRDTAGPFAERSFDDVGLFKVGVRRIQHERLARGEPVLENPRQPRVPTLGHPRRLAGSLTFFRIEIDVEVFGLQYLEVKGLVLDLVPPELLRCRVGRGQGADANAQTHAEKHASAR
jgi:hypothetical protein